MRRLSALAASAAAALCAGSLQAQVVDRNSVDSAGAQSVGGFSLEAAVSADGRFVAFESEATNLVAGDTNGFRDIFVRDRTLGITTRVNVTSAGAQAVGSNSFSPAITPDGRFVAFESFAANLVAGDTNGVFDVFVHDRSTAATTRASVASGGAQAAGGNSRTAAISADGRFVAFESAAANLVAGDTNGLFDVFVHDRTTVATTRVSVDSLGAQSIGGDSLNPSISADGRFVAFESAATNLVAGDLNGLPDIFVHDRLAGATTRVSVDSLGAEAVGGASVNAAISGNGSIVAFESAAVNLVAADTNALVDVFAHDRTTGATTRESVTDAGAESAGGTSTRPSLSADGRFVAFDSFATNLVPGDTNGVADVFLRDRAGAATLLMSTDAVGTVANGSSFRASVSADGRFVALDTFSFNLIPGDTNGLNDVVTAFNPLAPPPPPPSVAPSGGQVNDGVGDDIDVQETNESMAANWSGFVAGFAAIVGFEFAVGTNPGGSDVVPFTNVGDVGSFVAAGLRLDDSVYFVAIRAVDADGNRSAIVSSDGVRVRFTELRERRRDKGTCGFDLLASRRTAPVEPLILMALLAMTVCILRRSIGR